MLITIREIKKTTPKSENILAKQKNAIGCQLKILKTLTHLASKKQSKRKVKWTKNLI